MSWQEIESLAKPFQLHLNLLDLLLHHPLPNLTCCQVKSLLNGWNCWNSYKDVWLHEACQRLLYFDWSNT